MKALYRGVLVGLLMLSTAQASWAAFGAIAYSISTGRYGTSTECASRPEAEKQALKKCHAPDACIRVWIENGFAALAVEPNGKWHTGWSPNSLQEAEGIALRHAGPGGHILCSLYSGR
ncbi:MAG: DUF4189 domain-containing protein [Candidatus Xenobia bacterium]